MNNHKKAQNDHPEQELPYQQSDLYDDEIDEIEQEPPEEKVNGEDEKKARHEEFLSVIHPVTKTRMKLKIPKEDHILPNPNTEKEYEGFNEFLNNQFKQFNKDKK